MTDLFPSDPTNNLLPFDGIVNDLGIVIEDSDALYNQLLTELPWQSDKITLFGKTHITTRKIVWMGDTGQGAVDDTDSTQNRLSYTYSGHTRPILPWHDTVLDLKTQVEMQLAQIGMTVNFNTCLLNYYSTGLEGMGYHADDEKELGYEPIIASLSLGATRQFVFKHKKTQDKIAIHLASGQLIVMRGATQQYWKHAITKTKKINAGRISLTFRQMLNGRC